MNSPFFAAARQGENGWKRYLFGMLLIFNVALIVNLPFMFIISEISGVSGGNENLLSGHPVRTIILLGLVSAGLLLGVLLTVTHVHGRPAMTLITPERSINWSRLTQGITLWFSLLGITHLVNYLFSPSCYSLSFSLQDWLPFALVSLIALPMMSVSLGLLYSYLLQGLSLVIQTPIFLIITWGIVRGSMSFNLEMPSAYFFAVINAMLIAWIIIKDNKMELVIGMSIGGSLISLLFISPANSSFEHPTIFKMIDSTSFWHELISYTIVVALFLYFCFGRTRKLSETSTN